MDKRGKFIVIDGMDGSGKGTQIELLKKRLAGEPVLFTREPGGSPRAEELRAMILSRDGTLSNPVCDFFLFWAARGSHVEDVVIPALEAGMHVICDRYDSSTHAFQIRGEQSAAWLSTMFREIRRTLPKTYLPDLYVILDLEPSIAFERRAKDAQQAKSKFDVLPIEYHERVRSGFKEFAADYGPAEFVDASRSPEEMHEDVWRIVSAALAR